MTWLARTPLAVLRALLAKIPQLRAEESILAVNRTALGTGSMKRQDATALQRAWQRAASAQPARPKRGASPDRLRAFGIGLRTVPTAKKADA